jgi:hypothetical protein
VTQLVLPLHEVAIEPLHAAAETAADLVAEPLYVVAGASSTETSCLCVQV